MIKRFFLYVLGIVPGLVQAHLNSPYRGSLYIVLFFLFTNTAFMSRYWFSDTRLQTMSIIVSAMAAFVVWCHAYIDLIKRLNNTNHPEDSSISNG